MPSPNARRWRYVGTTAKRGRERPQGRSPAEPWVRLRASLRRVWELFGVGGALPPPPRPKRLTTALFPVVSPRRRPVRWRDVLILGSGAAVLGAFLLLLGLHAPIIAATVSFLLLSYAWWEYRRR